MSPQPPQSSPVPPSDLRDVRRVPWPEPVVQVLASRGDPRAVLHLLEQLAPAPIAQQRARSDALGLGEPVTRVVLDRRREEEARLGGWVPGVLAGITGEPATKSAPEWLAWWDMARTSYPAQIVAARPLPRASLRVTRGGAQPAELSLGQAGVVLVGRDAKCQLRLTEPGAAGLHAAVLRLHTRWLVRDEATPRGTRMGGARVNLAWLPPRVEVDLGDVAFELCIADDPPQRTPEGHVVVDPLTFQALRGLRHPSVCQGLVGLVQEARGSDWSQRTAVALFGDTEDARRFAEQLQADVVSGAGSARQELAATLGEDAGLDAAAWAPLLQRNAERLGPQVLPRGWLEATR